MSEKITRLVEENEEAMRRVAELQSTLNLAMTTITVLLVMVVVVSGTVCVLWMKVRKP